MKQEYILTVTIHHRPPSIHLQVCFYEVLRKPEKPRRNPHRHDEHILVISPSREYAVLRKLATVPTCEVAMLPAAPSPCCPVYYYLNLKTVLQPYCILDYLGLIFKRRNDLLLENIFITQPHILKNI